MATLYWRTQDEHSTYFYFLATPHVSSDADRRRTMLRARPRAHAITATSADGAGTNTGSFGFLRALSKSLAIASMLMPLSPPASPLQSGRAPHASRARDGRVAKMYGGRCRYYAARYFSLRYACLIASLFGHFAFAHRIKISQPSVKRDARLAASGDINFSSALQLARCQPRRSPARGPPGIAPWSTPHAPRRRAR